MAPRSSFLDRLTGSARPLPEQVARNLVNVLNTRKGCGSAIPDLGLGDYEEAPNTHDAVLVLERELRELVLRYEPRVLEPTVELRGGHGYRKVRFALQGTVDGTPRDFAIEIDTSTRQVEVWPEGS